jgi:3-dehydroquinate synthase
MTEQEVNIVLTGFSGTGKSLVGEAIAKRLNWDLVDTDSEIVRLAGKPIADIFAQDGEARFRELEREVIRRACQQKRRVIAVGGGAIVDRQNYELLAQHGLLICLEAKPETIYQRLFQNAAYSSEPEVRPLLADNDSLERITRLKASRQPYYASVDWTVHTDELNIAQVAEEAIRAWRLLRRYFGRNDRAKGLSNRDKDVACWVETATQSYPVFVGHGLLDILAEKIKGAGLSGTAVVISDETVFSLYGSKVERILEDAGFVVSRFIVPPGEATKNIDSAVNIYDFLVEHRVERDDVIIALGGGMVGDLAGFVAATFLRGMPWIQVPTSLVAMVDASIGGKVGINHPQGKNLIGSFYQPRFVLADVQTLSTLPQRELTSGWAEVIKYGLIADKRFFEFLEGEADKLINLEPNIVTQAIARSAAIKAQVVSQDEKEREGKRIILNYGHTIAHGLEAASQYGCYLHGEAVAIGMMGAARLSERLGLISSGVVKEQRFLLQRFSLPVTFSKVDVSGVLRAMELDKKTRGKEIHWVLLEEVGRVTIRSDVPQEAVVGVLQELSKP